MNARALRRQSRIDRGVCLHCSRAALPDSTRCAGHLLKARLSMRAVRCNRPLAASHAKSQTLASDAQLIALAIAEGHSPEWLGAKEAA